MVEILLLYYNRPEMVKSALRSVLEQTSPDWHLSVIDDSSNISILEILPSIFSQDIIDTKITVYNTNDTLQNKQNRGGSLIGKFMNQALIDSKADIGIMLCDDDVLIPNYIFLLNEFYKNNPSTPASYCHVIVFDPSTEDYKTKEKTPTFLNMHTYPINPCNSVDASQVSWKIREILDKNIVFPSPQTSNLDASFYARLFETFGGIPFNGITGQYKAFFHDSLTERNKRSSTFSVQIQ